MKTFHVWYWSAQAPQSNAGTWEYIASANAVDEAIACQIVEARLRLKGKLVAHPHIESMEAA